MAIRRSLFGDRFNNKPIINKGEQSNNNSNINKDSNLDDNNVNNNVEKGNIEKNITNINEKSINTNTNKDKWIVINNTNEKTKPSLKRPIIFKCSDDNKSVAFGYRLDNNNYVISNPYLFNKYYEENHTIIWQYVSNCKTLDMCPNKFPQCDLCKYSSQT